MTSFVSTLWPFGKKTTPPTSFDEAAFALKINHEIAKLNDQLTTAKAHISSLERAVSSLTEDKTYAIQSLDTLAKMLGEWRKTKSDARDFVTRLRGELAGRDG